MWQRREFHREGFFSYLFAKHRFLPCSALQTIYVSRRNDVLCSPFLLLARNTYIAPCLWQLGRCEGETFGIYNEVRPLEHLVRRPSIRDIKRVSVRQEGVRVQLVEHRPARVRGRTPLQPGRSGEAMGTKLWFA